MTWKDVRATLIWMVLLALGGTIAGGYYVAQLLSRSDAIIERMLREKLAQEAPDWNINFDSLKFDASGFLELSDLKIRSRKSSVAVNLLEVPYVRVELDRQLMIDHQQVVIRKVLLREPHCVLFRDGAGHWNFQDGRLPQQKSGVSPEYVIEHAHVALGIQQVIGGPVTEMILKEVDLKLQPEAHRRYRSRGECVVDGMGGLALTGLFDANSGEWRLDGQTSGLRISDRVLQELAGAVPGGSDRLAQFGIKAEPQATEASPFRYTSGTQQNLPTEEPTSTPVPAVRADAQITFHLGQDRPNSPVDYLFQASIERGQLSKAVIPVPLYDLSAEIKISPNHVVIRNLSAANGESRLYVDGELKQEQGIWRKGFEIKATKLTMDERIRRYLPPNLLKTYDLVQPGGLFNLALGVQHDGLTNPHIECQFEALNCSARFAQLPYPVQQIQGQVRKEGNLYRVSLDGIAGEHPVSLKGYILPEGDLTDSKLTLTSTGLPIDQRLLTALDTPELDNARKTLESLELTGVADCTAEFIRRPGIDSRYLVRMETVVRDGAIRFKNFPIPLTGFSGKLVFDPLKRNAFVFTNMEARHGNAIVRAEGVFDKATSPGMLALQMELLNVPIDSDLRRATVMANPGLEKIWADYGLDGDIDVDRVEIGWIPGGKAVVSLFGMQWKNGRLKPKVLPYAWDDIAGALQWENNRLTIHSLHGYHGETTYVHIDGSTNGQSAYIETDVSSELNWHVHLDSLQLVNLSASEDLKQALPVSVRKVVQTLNISGPVNLQVGIDLKGWNRDNLVTAAWRDSYIMLPGNRLNTGLELTDVSGQVRLLEGSWNGHEASTEGYVDLNTVKVLGLPLNNIKGPFRVRGEDILVGSPGTGEESPFSRENPQRDKRLSAEIFGGRIGLQSHVLMSPDDVEQLQYRLEMKLEDAELAEFARYRGIQEQRLSGKVNGEVTMTGMGSNPANAIGEGWVNITPAQLFDLPVFAQMFSLIQFRKPEETAFNYGFGEFTLHDGLVDFSTINLRGESLNLGGLGYVGYAGPNNSKLALDFYTHGQRRILQPLTDRWMRIQVVGTVSNPVPLVQGRIPVLNDALEGFMRAVESGQPIQPPPLRRRSTPAPVPPTASTRTEVPR